MQNIITQKQETVKSLQYFFVKKYFLQYFFVLTLNKIVQKKKLTTEILQAFMLTLASKWHFVVFFHFFYKLSPPKNNKKSDIKLI